VPYTIAESVAIVYAAVVRRSAVIRGAGFCWERRNSGYVIIGVVDCGWTAAGLSCGGGMGAVFLFTDGLSESDGRVGTEVTGCVVWAGVVEESLVSAV